MGRVNRYHDTLIKGRSFHGATFFCLYVAFRWRVRLFEVAFSGRGSYFRQGHNVVAELKSIHL